jgi:hypothetical protein
MEKIENNSPIHNFPKDYIWYKKIWSNITYYLSQISFLSRKNLLTNNDIRHIKKNIQNGDILLGWNFQHVSWLVIEWIVTHAMGYIGKWKCIHAYAHGVWLIWLRKILRTYDTLILIRPFWDSEKQKLEYRKFLISKLWIPYDYFFWLEENGEEKYFCTKLINDALISVWYNSNLESVRQINNSIDEILDTSFRIHRILKPQDMIYWNFQKIFFSENIQENKNTYSLIKWKFWTLLIPSKNNHESN